MQYARVLLIGTLTSPYIDSTEDYSAPTINEPAEVQFTYRILKFKTDELWVYDSATGEILYRPHDDADRLDANENNALQLAIWEDRTNAALALIKRGDIDLDHRNKFGATALHLAVAKRDTRVVKSLMTAGVDRSVHDNNGATALESAEKNGFSDIADLLR